MQKGTFGAKGAIMFQVCMSDGVTPENLTGVVDTFQTTNLITDQIVRSSADGSLLVDSESNVTYLPTADEVASIPNGRWTQYVVEMAYPDGSAARFMEGYLVGRGTLPELTPASIQRKSHPPCDGNQLGNVVQP